MSKNNWQAVKQLQLRKKLNCLGFFILKEWPRGSDFGNTNVEGGNRRAALLSLVVPDPAAHIS